MDGYINFEDYNASKVDIEEKIQMLGRLVVSCQNSQMNIMEKVNLDVDEFCWPYSFFESLDNELKRDFINNLLTREWRWSETDFDSIFKKSAQSVYQLSIENGSENISEINESHKYLETLAGIASKKRYTLNGL